MRLGLSGRAGSVTASPEYEDCRARGRTRRRRPAKDRLRRGAGPPRAAWQRFVRRGRRRGARRHGLTPSICEPCSIRHKQTARATAGRPASIHGRVEQWIYRGGRVEFAAKPVRKSPVPSDIEIAQAATMQPITEIAAKAGILEEELELYGRYKAKIDYMALARAPQGQARRQDHRRHRHHPDAARRGQDGHRRGPLRVHERHRHQHHARPARAVPRAGLRHQGRRGRRRLLAAHPHGGPQPPLHRRHPRRGHRQQPAGRHDRQPPHARQRARHRPADHLVAARRRPERPRHARDRQRPRRPPQRPPAPDRLRHHRRLRSHGHPRPGHLAQGPARAPGPHHLRLQQVGQRRSPPTTSAPAAP